ncbi:unnamed protein product [Clonostachys solani]|uniref:Zn(2)-C6 fungal-type domain-containing protein n=1 Tax=Clonostachys solani TaxID=160281 RepID=A0A9P0ERM6_9HYPO|nr:unnamed protein product [Clonostachys solani]
MAPASARTKNPKACEPCRRRKVRCDGNEPCSNCTHDPSTCLYRLKARHRSIQSRPAEGGCARPPTVPPGSPPRPRGVEVRERTLPAQSPDVVRASATSRQGPSQGPSPQLYECVAATHLSPRSTDSSQLFYGPSSSFAFLKQVHRTVLAIRSRRGSAQADTHPHADAAPISGEDDAGLDVFMQRNIFFGVPLKADPVTSPLGLSESIAGLIERPLAAAFLADYKAGSYRFLPVSPTSSYDALLDEGYQDNGVLDQLPLRRSLLLLVLAIGALQSTSHAGLADKIFLEAKHHMTAYEDAVAIPTIQLSLLMAEYQINMGRPSIAYLHVGSACRKGMAMGLAHIIGGYSYEHAQERSATLWSLYFYERREDVGWPYPEAQPLLTNLCRAGEIMEDLTESLYNRKTDTLETLHDKAQALYRRLQQWGDTLGIGSSSVPRQDTFDDPTVTLFLHNETVLHQNGNEKVASELWLRQACRNATDAAIDSIIFTDSMLGAVDFGKVRRHDSFFMEASSIVLLFDSLRHPTKHANNLIYINMALGCLRAMVQDDPVTSVSRSISRIVSVVQNAIGGDVGSPPLADGVTGTLPLALHAAPQHSRLNTNMQNPSVENLEPTYGTSGLTSPPGHHQTLDQDSSVSPFLPWSAFQSILATTEANSQFDLLTTDLSSHFPIDLNMSLDDDAH